MNPFIYALEHPVEAFADFGVLCLMSSLLVITTWALWPNVIAIYDEWATGGWTVNPPGQWIARIAIVPLVIGLDALLVSAMFYMLR